MSNNTKNYTPDFLEAVNYTLLKEGGFSNNPKDPGGATNFGIKSATLAKYLNLFQVSEETVKKLTKEDAIRIYFDLYWEPYNYKNIVYRPLRIKCFDWAVNAGHAQATWPLQRACNVITTGINVKNKLTPGYKNLPLLKVDGIFGSATLTTTNSYKGEDILNLMIEDFNMNIRPKMYQNNPNLEAFKQGFYKRDNERPR